MFNGMIHPIAPLSIRESFSTRGKTILSPSGETLLRTFPSVISDWRRAFGRRNCPSASFRSRDGATEGYDLRHEPSLPVIREIQHIVWQGTPKTGLIATYDTNSNGSIHPGRKMPVGERSARWALAEVYGFKTDGGRKTLEWMGPVYESHHVEGGKMVIGFKEETRRGLRLDQGVEVGFSSGRIRSFMAARVDGGKGTVIVWRRDSRTRCRSLCTNNLPMGGLMNARELPLVLPYG